MSLAKLYAKKDAKATQRRRLHTSERLERDRCQTHPIVRKSQPLAFLALPLVFCPC